jgi:choline dehydrogenase-like flavoprotein
VLSDARKISPGTVLRCDVCVVGGGAAGITTALELAIANIDTVLLEAGGLRQTKASQASLREGSDLVLPEPRSGASGGTHPPLDTVRQRRLGGTTGSWGGRCIPLDSIDFEEREYLAGSGWPITRSDLDPYYRRAQSYCEVKGFEYSRDLALPDAPNFLVHEGVRSALTDDKLLRYSRPTDFGNRYRGRLEQSRHTRVLYHANVLRLELDPGGTGVSRAVVAMAPGREFLVEARIFVLAGGGLETTRLVLVSRQHSQKPIGAGDASIGHYYMTHLDGFVGFIRFSGPDPRPAYSFELSRDGVYCRRLICLSDETLRNEGLLNFSAVLYMPDPEDATHGDSLLSAYALAKRSLYRARLGFKSRRYGMDRVEPFTAWSHARNIARDPGHLVGFGVKWAKDRWFADRKLPSFLTRPKSGEYRFLFSAEQSPTHSNAVSLSAERDEFGVPRLTVRWRVSSEDYGSVVRALAVVGSEIRRLGIGTASTPSSPEELAEAIGGGFLGGTHAMGTLRMSSSHRGGVVDQQCRLHGIPNLFVASSAVFPTGGFAAPTLTIVALAIRVADAVRDRLTST